MMKKVALIAICFSTALMLQGCVAALVGAGAGTTSVVTDSRTVGTQIDDSTLYSKANIKFYDNRRLFIGSRIIVTSYNGNILLTGQANSEQILKAESLMKEIEGVNKVYNQLTNGKPISPNTIVNDGWITTQVKSELVIKTGSQALKIKVVTENSNVFLLGNMDKYMAKLMAESASKIYGVKHVKTIFSYTSD